MTEKLPEIDILVKTHKGQKNYNFSSTDITVGRSKKTDLHIPLEGMSRNHFKVLVLGQALAIVDLGSANGTLLNGNALVKDEPTPFLKGDIIEIPGVNISFTADITIVEEAEILITEDMLSEDEEDEESYSTDNVKFDGMQVMPKEQLEKTLLTDSGKDLKAISEEETEVDTKREASLAEENSEKNIEFKYEEDAEAVLQERIDSIPHEVIEEQREEKIAELDFKIGKKEEASNISLNFDESDDSEKSKESENSKDAFDIDSDSDSEIEISEVIDVRAINRPKEVASVSAPILSGNAKGELRTEQVDVTKTKAVPKNNNDSIINKSMEEFEHIKIDFENTKKIELNKVRADLERSKNIEIEKLNKITQDRELELQIINEEFDQSKKAELEKIKRIEDQKTNELQSLQKEKEELEKLIEKEQLHFMKLDKEKNENIQKEKEEALSLIEKECLEYKFRLLEESKLEAENEKRKILDLVEFEKDKLLKKSKKVLNEAKEEAEVLLLHAEKESRKKKDDNYEEILESQRNHNLELQKLRRQAEEDAKSYYSNIKDEALDILKSAKEEAANIKDVATEDLDYIKKSAESAAQIAHTEADRIRKESSDFSREAKVKSDKILKNAYATAMLIKNTTQEKFEVVTDEDVDEDRSFFDELEDEFPQFETEHQNKVQNIFSLINKTSEEMDEVLKEKQKIYEEENKHLRESELKRIQIEAREEAIKIKAQAESEAEEIIRNAYLHSKTIEIEATSRIKEKEIELEELSSLSSVEIDERSSELAKIAITEKELENSIVELTVSKESLQTQFLDEKKRFEQFFNDSSEKEKDYIHQNHELEIEHTNWCNRVSKAKKKFDLFEIQSHEKKDELGSQLRVLNTDKEKLLVVINPLREEAAHLRKEKEDLYQENSHFFENLKTRKFEYEKLKDINEGLEKNIHANNITIEESNQSQISQNKKLADLDFQLRNIDSELKAKRNESERERELILHDAKVEEHKLREELELIKANKQAYAEEEIAKLKRTARDECSAIIADGETEKKSLIENGYEEAKKLKDETNQWIKEVQEKIENKNKEIENVEEEGRLFLIERKKEAEKQFNEKIELANSQVAQQLLDSKAFMKKNEDESNAKIVHIGERFQQKMKERENLFTEEKKAFIAAIEKKKAEVIALANSNAKSIVAKSEANAHSILAEAKIREEEVIKQKETVLLTIEKESGLLKAQLNDELNQHKKSAEKEIAQMKVREFETQKQKRMDVEKQIESRKKNYVSDITENVGIQLQLKMKNAFGKQMTETHFEKLKSEIKGIVESAVFPEKDDSNKPKKMLMGNGRITDKVKKFYIKVAVAVIAPIILLIINAIFPQFFPAIKGVFISGITTEESASDIFLQKEIDKKRNRPKFQPKYIRGFKENYTDNMIYTKKYAESVITSRYKDKWTISLNTYLVDELELNDNLIVNLISYENNLHRQLLEIKSKINPSFIEQGITRMREKESEYTPKIRALFKKEKDYIFFKNFKRTFFNDYIKKNK